MKISIIIVNYNVRFFLEQCLQSVEKAIRHLDGEIIIVDNNSVDGSVNLVKEKFQAVRLIENSENVGFSKANNIGIREAHGEYILLLNPDTVVEEDTFQKVVEYMDSHPDCGALGVKMIDGKGNFLPESKRGLPTPEVAFYKVFGLSRLFPRSETFGKYHLSYLDPDKIHEVDVLCGAFMLLRKNALDIAGLLDETYFMYGEDIDLSYRIKKAGFQVIYFPLSTIIHYKGESTRKSSLNYVYLFYKAMQIFARKYFTRRGAWWFGILINMAIYFRASISLIKRFFIFIFLPLLDGLAILGGFYLISSFWARFWFHVPHYYPHLFLIVVVPVYIFIWLLSLFYSGAYDYPVRLKNVLTGAGIGFLIILIFYALLPVDYRFSRILILFGAGWTTLATVSTRLILSFILKNHFPLESNIRKNILIAGSIKECERVKNILEIIHIHYNSIQFVSPERNAGMQFIGSVGQISEIIHIHHVNEIIYCAKDLPTSLIINQMLELSGTGCDFKIAPADTESIVGSNSINTAGDLYVMSINSVVTPKNRRNKRTFDILASLVVIITLPIWVWIKKDSWFILRSALLVVSGQKTWISCSTYFENFKRPSSLKPGIFQVANAYPFADNDPAIIEKLEAAYSQDYNTSKDLKILWLSLKYY